MPAPTLAPYILPLYTLTHNPATVGYYIEQAPTCYHMATTELANFTHAGCGVIFAAGV